MDLRKLADLARLQLTDAEREQFSAQLDHILGYVEQIQAVDTTGVSETAHPLEITTAWRADAPRPSLSNQEALRNAPDADRAAGLFRVPKVIG
jgi:aspartyl-tRNA(Asn)/glutamyl-tRNA(Gln) amidotransferase subunit C